jgi:HEAT repeat protein
MLPIFLSLFMGLSGAPLNRPGVRDVNTAFQRLASAKDWREEAAAVKDLVAFGDKALPIVEHSAIRHSDVKVRRICYQILTKTFIQDTTAARTVATDGLRDMDDEIRYCCAFCLGEHKVYNAHRLLRIVLEDKSASDQIRLAAAKSLAELGEVDVIRELYYALGDDHYMPRYLGNLGIKALSGKDLNDFDGYQYGEDAFVSGGREAEVALDAVSESSHKAKRFRALASFCQWLKEQRPELYKHLSEGW